MSRHPHEGHDMSAPVCDGLLSATMGRRASRAQTPGHHSQRTTLEAIIAGRPLIVATSDQEDLDAALAEARDDLVRQITDAKSHTEPMNNPNLRDTP